jgi:hypothetical protein
MVVVAVGEREKRSHLHGKRKVWTYLLSFTVRILLLEEKVCLIASISCSNLEK